MSLRFHTNAQLERQLDADKKRHALLSRNKAELEDELELISTEMKFLNARKKIAEKKLEEGMERR